MARALGLTPEEAQADGIDGLTRYLKGAVGLLFTNRPADSVLSYFASLTAVDFARAGAVAPRDFVIPPGKVYSTAGEVPAEHDVGLAHTLEPELRKLGVPTRLLKGEIVLENTEGYPVCREGQTLDARQTRLLKIFSVCMSEFRVRVRAYWTAATGDVAIVEGMEGAGDEEDMEEDEGE
jgi:mRNA turnover protein 4